MDEPMEIAKSSDAASKDEIPAPDESDASKPSQPASAPDPPSTIEKSPEPAAIAPEETIEAETRIKVEDGDAPGKHEDDLAEEKSLSEDLESDSANELAMMPAETFGKGKRARIPNKRYSDIILSPPLRPTPPRLAYENGDKPEPKNGENEPSTSSPSAKRPKLTTDVSTNPIYKQPFLLGWRRELVYRMNTEHAFNKQIGDVYYYSPTGRKFRSRRELNDALTRNKDLTIDNFTFLKEPVGVGDPEEIVRDARVWPKKTQHSSELLLKGASPRLRPAKASPRGDTSDEAGASPRAKPRPAIRVKLPPSRTKSDKQRAKTAAEEDFGEIDRKRRSNNLEMMESKRCQPCSIRCGAVMGLVPTLQCRLCLCLYHYECIGLAPIALSEPFICKNCQIEHGTPGLPPLTPINTLKSLQPQSSTILPKLQRISQESGQIPRLLPLATLQPPPSTSPSPPQSAENKSSLVVGGVTTWLPHSSTIVDAAAQKNKENEPLAPDAPPPRPQYVEYLAGRKFLIIPKHNVVSVTPTNNINHNNNVNVAAKVDLGENEVGEAKKAEMRAEAETERSADVSRNRFSDTNYVTPSRSTSFDNACYYMQNVSYGYKSLLHVFQYLKVQDLLRAGCVCKLWREIASHSSLWRTVRMKNSQVHSFDGLANSLQAHGTIQLDLRKMLLPTTNDDIWPEFSKAIRKVVTLRKIEFCRCPASVVEELIESNPNLESINAVTIKCTTISLSSLTSMKNLKELRLKSTSGLTLNSDLDALTNLTTLVNLSLTSIKSLNKLNLNTIATLTNLESLDLGECNNFPSTFGADILLKLVKLEKLRLERGQGECHTFEMLAAVEQMPKLEQLELVNFDVKSGFDLALGACANIRKLLVIPTYISQSATTNHMVLGGVLRLRATLAQFVWGVTLELLRVTELFVDQCEDPELKKEKPAGGESIPVLKPVPSVVDGEIEAAFDPPQVEILPLANLQKLLLISLPKTRVRILKIPFHATWRQSITESVN